jgi:hypothetical protein
MVVTAAVEFDLDTPVGGAAVTTELDLETGLGRCSEALATELDLDTGCWACAGVGVVEDERMVVAEFARESEGGARGRGPLLLKLEAALDGDDWRSDETEPFLATEGGAAALRTVAVELERDTVPCSWRALVEEFALDTDDGPPPAL